MRRDPSCGFHTHVTLPTRTHPFHPHPFFFSFLFLCAEIDAIIERLTPKKKPKKTRGRKKKKKADGEGKKRQGSGKGKKKKAVSQEQKNVREALSVLRKVRDPACRQKMSTLRAMLDKRAEILRPQNRKVRHSINIKICAKSEPCPLSFCKKKRGVTWPSLGP